MRKLVPHLHRLLVIALLICGFHAAEAQSTAPAPQVDTRTKPQMLLPSEPEAPATQELAAPEPMPSPLSPAVAPAPRAILRAPLTAADAPQEAPELVPGEVTDSPVRPEAPVAPKAPKAPAKPRTVEAVEPLVP